MWRSLVARLLWEQDVAGSNPVIPTIPCQCTTAQPRLIEMRERAAVIPYQCTTTQSPG